MKSISKSTAISDAGGFKGSGGRLSTPSFRSILSRSVSSKHKSMSGNPSLPKPDAENTPPLDPNVRQAPVSPLKLKPSMEIPRSEKPQLVAAEEITASNDKRKELSASADPAVKVVVRIRPTNGHEFGGGSMVKKVSSDSLLLGDREFTFDSVFDSRTSQNDVFQKVGVPLVKDALAGYNTSILSYGQSGSGKTYTMWGPPSSMVEEPSSSSNQGLVPRIFQILFSEIEKEQAVSEGKQVNHQCRCSFLEIYNEKIGDLLDPTQRNLQIKDDAKNGLYVENLTEEYVTSYEDVMQMLIKGLSSRKVGTTTMNSKSSRSHIIFTCVIESWCKEASSKCFSSSRTSRISLIDLAGLDTNKVDEASREWTKETKHVKKSLSHLGRLVHALAKSSQETNAEHFPYQGSKLTHLLRESIGGNAKLTIICAVSADNKNDSEILSTLRFGQRVKCVKNDPVINEITEEDMNGLSDQIRQLKEELIKAKSHGYNSVESRQRFLDRHYARESLNQLRVSLNRSLMLPPMIFDTEEEVNVDEDDVKDIHKQLDKLKDEDDISREQSEKGNADSIEEESCDTDDFSEDFANCPEEFETDDESRQSYDEVASNKNLTLRGSISVNALRTSQILEEPVQSESPKIGKHQRKSTVFSSSPLANQTNVSESTSLAHNISETSSLRQSQHIRSSSVRASLALAASLQRGLEIIDNQRSSQASNKPPVAFSFEHLTLKPSPEVLDKIDSSTEIFPEKSQLRDGQSALLCPSCQRKRMDSDEVEESLKTWIVPVDGAENNLSDDKKKIQELENICKEQADKIEELSCLVEQYKLEKEVKDGRTSQILCIEASKEVTSLLEERKNKDVNCNKVMEESCEIKQVQEELKPEEKISSFDANEKEELLKEIHSLGSKLQQPNLDAHPNKSIDKLRSSLLRRSVQLQKSISGVMNYNNSEEELDRERERWTEMESEWISLTDELRVDIETHRRRSEQLEDELRLEKNSTEELDDALRRAVLGHARMVEHYSELQEKHNDLVSKHRAIMEGIAEVKRAAAKAGAKGHGSRFAKSVAAELSTKRVERERERELLKKENQRLRIQLRDTAEAVHAAGELLVRLREAEQATSVAEENLARFQEENEKLKKQIEKLKRKHKMEMITMKQYLAESKLPGSALPPMYKEDDYENPRSTVSHADDDQAWRAEFGAIYQDHY